MPILIVADRDSNNSIVSRSYAKRQIVGGVTTGEAGTNRYGIHIRCIGLQDTIVFGFFRNTAFKFLSAVMPSLP